MASRGVAPVGLVVTVYNKAPYLAETIASVMAQTLLPAQTIVVNDGSTDDSLNILNELATRHPLQIVSTKNSGAAASRNEGLKRVNQPYAVCLDGDDLLNSHFIEKTYTQARSSGAQIVRSNVSLFGISNEPWHPQPYDPYFIRYDNSIPLTSLFVTELWKKTGGFENQLPFNEDWNFWIRCSRHQATVAHIDEELYRYRKTAAPSLSTEIEGKWDLPAALMMVTESDLYNIEDLKFAQETFRQAGSAWAAALAAHRLRQPQSWILPFIEGLIAQHTKRDNEARALFLHSVQASNAAAWLPLFQLARMVDIAGQGADAANLYHHVRILRPDMHFMVGQRLTELGFNRV